MDCRRARRWLTLRQELDRGDEQPAGRALADHLAECPECSRRAARERQFDRWLSRLMQDVPVPVDLAPRIRSTLGRLRRRRRHRFVLATLSAAAAILLAIGGVFYYQQHQAPREVAFDVDAYNIVPPPKTGADLEGLFREHYGIVIRFPEEFRQNWNFELFTLGYLDRVGRDGPVIPVMKFVKGKEQAVVQLWAPGQYDPKQMQQYKDQGGASRVRVLGKPDGQSYIALVVLEPGSRLESFLRPLHLRA